MAEAAAQGHCSTRGGNDGEELGASRSLTELTALSRVLTLWLRLRKTPEEAAKV